MGIPAFLNQSNKYIDKSISGLDLNEILESGIQGKLNISGIWGIIIDLLGSELENAISGVIAILIIIIIHSLLNVIIENLGNNQTSQIAYFVEFLLIVSIITSNFADILIVVENAINQIIDFMKLFIPLLVTLMLTTGSITTTSTLGSTLILLINIIGSIISSLILPLIMVGMTLSIVNSFSNKIHISRLTNIIKSAVIWILSIVLTVFVCALGIEGTLSSSVDGMTAKTAKATLSTFIPVVGKIMGDSVDTVIGCANILKNAVGVIGLVVLLGIVLIPIIKVTITWFLLRMIAAISETVADEKIIKLLDNISDTYKLLFGILISVSIMFFVGITIVLRMTNVVAM